MPLSVTDFNNQNDNDNEKKSYPNKIQTQMGMTLLARHRRAYVLESFISISPCDAQIGLS